MMGIMTLITSFIYEVLILDQKLYQMLDVVIHTHTHTHTHARMHSESREHSTREKLG